MSENPSQVPRSFWVISGLALVWNLMGLAAYVMQVTISEESLMALAEAERAMYVNMPSWATAAFALAVTAGTLACILLLLRKTWAMPAFLVSLGAVFVQMYHSFVIADAIDILGPSSVIGPALVVAIGVGLVWYARYAKEKGWLN